MASQLKTPFTVSANPGTDIWKKPPSTNDFNAPYTPHSSAPLVKFTSASITFTSTYTQKFDQAGILFRFTKPSRDQKWIKAGIELFNGKPHLSTVCCDNYADWGIATTPGAEAICNGAEAVTILVEKEDSPTGRGLWIYHVNEDGEKIPMREIAWVYEGGGEGWDLEISAAVARPGREDPEALEAKFLAFDVKWEA